jgi:hypothetical protein
MSGGRWDVFYSGSQDSLYRESAGVVAATDGSVDKDQNEGMCMGAGIAFRVNEHELADSGTLIPGYNICGRHLCSFDHYCYNIRVLLTILTDSANIMFAMQHCSCCEKWRDFSNHPVGGTGTTASIMNSTYALG